MNRTRANRTGRRGFTLIELLVVVLIVVIVGAATIKVAVFDQGGRQVSEAARILQAALVGARDAAYRANSPRGIRLLPDPAFNGINGGALAASRMISIEAAPDYNTGLVNVLAPAPVTVNSQAVNFLVIQESVSTPVGASSIPNEPTSWYWNVRQGDKIRIDDSGRYYTVAGPMVVGAFDASGATTASTQLSNTDRYVNNGPPGKAYIAGSFVTYDPNPINTVASGGNHFAESLFVVNGQDDDGDGWVDEGFDGIDNDGDGVIDPAYNGIDDDGNGVIDDAGELGFNNFGEWEPEQFVGNEFSKLSIGGETNKRYTIVRRPIVSEGAREVPLPAGAVIDLTTWNATGALDKTGTKPQPTLPERSRLPIDPYSHTVDVMLTPDGQVMTASAGQSAGAMSSGTFPTGNMPFYHFWIAQREDVYDPLFGTTNAKAIVNGATVSVPGAIPGTFTQVPIANPNYAAATPQTYLLPMPEGAQGNYYSPSGALIPAPTPNGPFLKGDIRLVTLFVKTAHVLTYDLGASNFDPTNTSLPYTQAQFGIREAK